MQIKQKVQINFRIGPVETFLYLQSCTNLRKTAELKDSTKTMSVHISIEQDKIMCSKFYYVLYNSACVENCWNMYLITMIITYMYVVISL